MAFNLNLSTDAEFTNAFKRNEDEARANAASAPTQFWADFWARQAYFWVRMQRQMSEGFQ